MMGLTSLACVTGPVELSAIRIRGTVTSTVNDEPIEGVGVRLGWQFAGFFASRRWWDVGGDRCRRQIHDYEGERYLHARHL